MTAPDLATDELAEKLTAAQRSLILAHGSAPKRLVEGVGKIARAALADGGDHAR